MRCSDCGKEVRPVVALDIDGTLGNWHDHWFRFADGYFNTVFSRHWLGDEPLHVHMGITLEEYRQAKLVFRQGGYKRTMPMYRYADELTAHLGKQDVEVWMTTTRPYLRLDNIDPDTRDWLARNGVWHEHLLYDDDKYQALESLVGADRIVAVLDDEPECYQRAGGLGLSPILMMRRHNEAFRAVAPEVVAAHSLVDAERMIMERVRDWRHVNGTD
jgi:hypothetical protein